MLYCTYERNRCTFYRERCLGPQRSASPWNCLDGCRSSWWTGCCCSSPGWSWETRRGTGWRGPSWARWRSRTSPARALFSTWEHGRSSNLETSRWGLMSKVGTERVIKSIVRSCMERCRLSLAFTSFLAFACHANASFHFWGFHNILSSLVRAWADESEYFFFTVLSECMHPCMPLCRAPWLYFLLPLVWPACCLVHAVVCTSGGVALSSSCSQILRSMYSIMHAWQQNKLLAEQK